MVDAELAAGRLVRPFAKRLAAKASNVFALAWRDAEAPREDQRIAAFRDFALDEACGCELAAGPCGMPASGRDSRTRAGWMARRAARRAMIAGGNSPGYGVAKSAQASRTATRNPRAKNGEPTRAVTRQPGAAT
jgi:hypothetical protein